MRIGRWKDSTEIGQGFIDGEDVVPFADGDTVAHVLAQGLDRLPGAWLRAKDNERLPLSAVSLIAPLEPASIRDFVAFEEHVEGMTAGPDGFGNVPAEWFEAPTFYFTNPHTVLGPNEPVRPPVTARLDYELEVAAVIGGVGGANLDAEAAQRSIFGYTIMNDWSARDLQFREMQVRLGPAKGKDFGLTLGPWIATADELERYLDEDGFLAIRAEARVNGDLIGEDLVSNMGWPFPVLVAYASRNSRIVAGDVLGSGTVGNGGCLGELWGRRGEVMPKPLLEGDEVQLTVEGLGELVSFVGETVGAPELPAASRRPRNRWRPLTE